MFPQGILQKIGPLAAVPLAEQLTLNRPSSNVIMTCYRIRYHSASPMKGRNARFSRWKFIRTKRIRQEGLVRHDEIMKCLHDRGIVLRGGDLDEAPQAYRRLPGVLDRTRERSESRIECDGHITRKEITQKPTAANPLAR